MLKVLIVVYYDYHLYSYLPQLVESLQKQGFRVDVLTCDSKLEQKLDVNDEARCIHSYFARWFINRMDNIFTRIFGWVFGWVWSFVTTARYDLIIAPTDNKPFYHMITSWKKSIICQGGLGMHDKQYLKYTFGNGAFPEPNQFLFKKHFWLDTLLGGSYLKNVRGSQSTKHYTVLGARIAQFYQDLGHKSEHIHVTGNPNYHGLEVREFRKEDIAKTLGLLNRRLYVFFCSKLIFDDDHLSRLSEYLDIIFGHNDHVHFCIKLHPRISQSEYQKLSGWLTKEHVGKTVSLLNTFPGDDNNVQLISLSDCVFVEESNVGLLAAQQQRPLFVINLDNNEAANDNIFLYYSGILDAATPQKFENQFIKYTADDSYVDIIRAQNLMVKELCIPSSQACDAITKVATSLMS